MNWYLKALNKYAVFRGRSCRKEFRMFTLFDVIIELALFLIEMLAGCLEIAHTLYVLTMFIPRIAVGGLKE